MLSAAIGIKTIYVNTSFLFSVFSYRQQERILGKMWVGEPFCLILNDSLLRVEFLLNSTRLFLVLLLLLLQISLRFF